uniref:Major facilitator superfamily (MFS) profile domain-containing protein n=1 Tax=Plectus sambesii TaxID=2011161 RepID=A0A914WPG8_9BILA
MESRPTPVLCCFKNKTRYLILILTTLCLTAILSNLLTLNFTLICMTDDPDYIIEDAPPTTTAAPTDEDGNTTVAATIAINIDTSVKKPEQYSGETKSILFGATAIGTLMAVLPVNTLIEHTGPKKIFVVLGFVSVVSTALVPLSVSMGVSVFIAIRVIQGLTAAACMPVIGCMTSDWATLLEHGAFMGIATGYTQLASVFTMPVSGELCVSSLGWPAVYYLHAIITFVLFVMWTYLYHEKPRNSPWVGEKELRRVTEGKPLKLSTSERAKIIPFVPYGKIIRTRAVWAIIMATIANFSGMHLILLWGPTYLSQTLLFSVKQTGLYAAIPTLLQFFVKLIVGFASDKIRFLSDTVKVKLFNSIAMIGMGVFFVLLAIVPVSEQIVCLLLFIGSATILGFNAGGFFKSVTLVARHYNHVVMGIITLITCLNQLIMPLLVQALTPNNSEGEWRLVYLIHAAIMGVGGVFFFVFGSGDPAEWALLPATPNDIKPEHLGAVEYIPTMKPSVYQVAPTEN